LVALQNLQAKVIEVCELVGGVLELV